MVSVYLICEALRRIVGSEQVINRPITLVWGVVIPKNDPSCLPCIRVRHIASIKQCILIFAPLGLQCLSFLKYLCGKLVIPSEFPMLCSDTCPVRVSDVISGIEAYEKL